MRLPESIVYMTLCNSPGLQRVHISAKQIFHAPLHPSNKKFLSPRFWETRDQRSPESFPSGRRGRAWVRGCISTHTHSHRKNWFVARCEYLHLIKKNSQQANRRCEFFLIRCKPSQRAANQFLR